MAPPKKIRPIRIEGEVAFVPLTKGYEAIIDASDAHLVHGAWGAQVSLKKDGTIRTVYAVQSLPRKGSWQPKLRLHRVILGLPDGIEVDHRDGDGLNNRRHNLRPASDAENARNARLSIRNTSGLKGVSWVAGRKSWQAQITVDGKKRHIGRFSTKEEASARYAEASREFHKDYGRAV